MCEEYSLLGLIVPQICGLVKKVEIITWISTPKKRVNRMVQTISKPTYEELEAEIKRKDQLLDHIWSAATNNGMSAAYARTYIVLALKHPKEVLRGEVFDFTVSEIQRLACVSDETTTKFFRDMSAVGSAEYSCPPVKNSENEEGKGQFTRQATIKLLPGSEQANTKASPNRIKEREAETKRREERTAKLNIVPCPHCGCEDEEQLYSALVPVCKSCGKAYQDKSQIIKTKDIRVIEEVEPEYESVPASDEPMQAKPLHEDIKPATDMPSCEPEQLTVQPTAIVHENPKPTQQLSTMRRVFLESLQSSNFKDRPKFFIGDTPIPGWKRAQYHKPNEYMRIVDESSRSQEQAVQNWAIAEMLDKIKEAGLTNRLAG